MNPMYFAAYHSSVAVAMIRKCFSTALVLDVHYSDEARAAGERVFAFPALLNFPGNHPLLAE